jgi:hypothetical protein
VTAAFAAAGAAPVLAGREELVASVAMLGGPAGEAMAEATERAEAQAGRLLAEVAGSGGKGAARKLIAVVGVAAVREAIDLYRAGGQFRADLDAAWLSLVLRDLRVRDDAWSRMDPRHAAAHLRLWTDLTRRARPGFVAAPASLLAFVAWQSGNGALANVALDRAQAQDEHYTMATLLREVIDVGVPPDKARPPMTPEEVAASYAQGGADYPGDPGDADPPGLVPPLDDSHDDGDLRLPDRIREPFARFGAMPCPGRAACASWSGHSAAGDDGPAAARLSPTRRST